MKDYLTNLITKPLFNIELNKGLNNWWFSLSTFTWQVHIAGGSSFRTSRLQPAKAIRKEKRLKTAWLSRFSLAGAEGIGLACRLGRCFCILCMQWSPQETRFSPVGSVGASAYLYAEVSTGDPHPTTLSECLVFIFCTYKKQQTPQKRCLLFWQGQKDLNPRHSVLEWLLDLKKKSKTCLFKPYITNFKKINILLMLYWWYGVLS